MTRTVSIQRISGQTVLSITTIGFMFPIYWLFVTSLKAPEDIFSFTLQLIPQTVTWENYARALNETSMLQYLLNSVIVTTATTLLVLSVASLSAYAVSRFTFVGRRTYHFVILSTQVMPGITFLVPIYLLWLHVGLFDTRLSLIITYSGLYTPVATWLLTNYFRGVPKQIDESALIDGASRTRILVQMIIPLSKPGLLAVALSTFTNYWQELMIAITLTYSDSMRTIPAGISSFLTESGIRWGPLTASGVVASLPILLVYILLQKNLVRGLTAGAIKG